MKAKARVILRFRDLVTEEGGTVAEHRAILRSAGRVWWGWWMRQYETPPRQLFSRLRQEIEAEGMILGYLFNTGEGRLFTCKIVDVRVAPPGSTIATPDPSLTPEYYVRGRYPAWFLLTSLDDAQFDKCRFRYESFPTRPEMQATYKELVGQPVRSLDGLRQIDVTLWVVREESDPEPST